jgi:hypothetical protein
VVADLEQPVDRVRRPCDLILRHFHHVAPG